MIDKITLGHTSVSSMNGVKGKKSLFEDHTLLDRMLTIGKVMSGNAYIGGPVTRRPEVHRETDSAHRSL
jgi:hypothetical protein